MTRITIDDALRGALDAANDEAELVDGSGQRVGFYFNEEAYRRIVCRWANLDVSDDVLESARRETESYSTAEVLERLRSL